MRKQQQKCFFCFSFFFFSDTLLESNEIDSYQLHAHNGDHFPTLWVPLMNCNSIHYTGLSNRGLDVIEYVRAAHIKEAPKQVVCL